MTFSMTHTQGSTGNQGHIFPHIQCWRELRITADALSSVVFLERSSSLGEIQMGLCGSFLMHSLIWQAWAQYQNPYITMLTTPCMRPTTAVKTCFFYTLSESVRLEQDGTVPAVTCHPPWSMQYLFCSLVLVPALCLAHARNPVRSCQMAVSEMLVSCEISHSKLVSVWFLKIEV